MTSWRRAADGPVKGAGSGISGSGPGRGSVYIRTLPSRLPSEPSGFIGTRRLALSRHLAPPPRRREAWGQPCTAAPLSAPAPQPRGPDPADPARRAAAAQVGPITRSTVMCLCPLDERERALSRDVDPQRTGTPRRVSLRVWGQPLPLPPSRRLLSRAVRIQRTLRAAPRPRKWDP